MYLQPCQIQFLFKDELIHELKQTLNAIKLEEKGVYVQASTLGSLEALLEFLRTSEVPVSSRAQPESVVVLVPLLSLTQEANVANSVYSMQELILVQSIKKM